MSIVILFHSRKHPDFILKDRLIIIKYLVYLANQFVVGQNAFCDQSLSSCLPPTQIEGIWPCYDATRESTDKDQPDTPKEAEEQGAGSREI
ncbi:hypothetical protein BDGGKGIB_00040 [Nodularia sphaerocarpa UHCC 0038]|nr:hypothetical protein BDGGKGIB_00040 [Nodularia sphaerocarpa UHCC 0038]